MRLYTVKNIAHDCGLTMAWSPKSATFWGARSLSQRERRFDLGRRFGQCRRHGAGLLDPVLRCRVDPETGKVTILRFVAAQDVGCAIHPSYVEGQIQGGVAQGIGWALNEEYIYDKNGRLDNAGFLDYRVPVASDMPMIEPILVEVPNPAHPFGAKGVGEVNIVPPMAAIANAIDSAIHRRLTEMPMSPPKVRAALDRAGADD